MKFFAIFLDIPIQRSFDMAHFEVRGKGHFEVRGKLPPCAIHGMVYQSHSHPKTLIEIAMVLSTWPILKFVGKDILKFVGNCRRTLSMAWLISGGRLPETIGGLSAEC